jgi:hypothetical protein
MRAHQFSWITLSIVGAVMGLAALWVALTPAGDQTELRDRTWDQFVQQDPEVASLYSMDLVVLGGLGAGFGFLVVAVAVVPFRQGERWAWAVLWLAPITSGAVALRMLASQYGTGYFYAGLAAAALVALLLPARRLVARDGRTSQP